MSRDQFDGDAARRHCRRRPSVLQTPILNPLPLSLPLSIAAEPLHLAALAAAAAVVLNRAMKTLGSAVKLEARKLGGLAANLVHVKAKGLIGTVTIFALLNKIDFDFRES